MIAYLVFFISTVCTFVSENGQYQVSVTFHGGTVFEAEQFSLRGRDNVVIYHVDDPGVQTFFVSNQGTVFALSEQHAVFYDLAGACDTLARFAFLNNSGFSEHDDLFFLSLQDGMHVYTLDGRLRYTLMPGRLFSSIRHGATSAVVSADTLRLYNEGVLIHTKILKTAYVQRMYITGSGTIRVEEHGSIEVFDLMTGEKVEQ